MAKVRWKTRGNLYVMQRFTDKVTVRWVKRNQPDY